MCEACWLWRRAWRRVVRTLGSLVFRRELSAFESVLPTSVVRRVDKSVRELLVAGSVITWSVCGYCEKDSVVDV